MAIEPQTGEQQMTIAAPEMPIIIPEKENKETDKIAQVTETIAADIAEGLNVGADEIIQIINDTVNEFFLNFTTVNQAGTLVKKAYCKDAAGAGTTIDAYLDTDGTGTEVTVNCSVVGGSALNAAIPRLADGTLILVTKISGSWYCNTVFQASEDCACS